MMIAVKWSDDLQAADLSLTPDGLAHDGSLATAIIISLASDARARPDDILPPGDNDRRGWVGNVLSDIEDNHGSRLWLLRRAKQTEETRRRAEEYCREALAWIIERKLASAIDVAASWIARGWLLIQIGVHLPDGGSENYAYRFATEAA